MPDCPTNDPNCLPAGSNAVDPCSPCFEPTCENFLEAQAAIARQLCAVGNQVKAWNQRLDKFRNRMDRLERTIDGIPTDTADALVSPCSNLADLPEEGADSILACGSGAQVGMLPEVDGCSDIKGVGSKWLVVPHGLSFRPLETVQTLTTSWATQNIVALNEYDEIVGDIPCGAWALIDYQDFLTGVTSVTGGTSLSSVNGVLIGAQYITNGSDAAFAGSALIPLTEKRITLAVSNSFSGSVTHTSSILRLWGYFV